MPYRWILGKDPLKLEKTLWAIRKSMDWFLYDNGLRHERVEYDITDYGETLNLQKKSFIEPGNKVSLIYWTLHYGS